MKNPNSEHSKRVYSRLPLSRSFPAAQYLFMLAFGLMMSFPLSAQKKRVQLVQADQMAFDKSLSEVRIVTGNVIFEHDSALLYCDSAVFNEKSNHVEAYGKVHIKVNDTLSIYGDKLIYEGSTRIADLIGNARLVDNTTTLLTPTLRYNRNTRTGVYNEGGQIDDQRNHLTSIRGIYFAPEKQFFFRDSVRLHNPDYDMESDTLHYNTGTEVARFFGRTIIRSDENTIICRQGWYDTRNDLASFSRRASILMENRVLYGDSIYYDRNLSFGEAFRNIEMLDTEKDLIIRGGLAIYREAEGDALVTDSALAIMTSDEDSLFLHSDTLVAYFDSTGETQQLHCFHHVKFFRPDLQGMADSLAYIVADSLIRMFGDPVLWSEVHQMTGDTIRIELEDDQVHFVYIQQDGFIASLDDTNAYNQLKGLEMKGYFRDNEMFKMEITGNAETIYYVREDDGRLTGINKAVSSDITIRLKDRKIRDIIYIRDPEAVLYPPDQYPDPDRTLEGFQWLGKRRPRQAADVFRW